ncbi:MAG: thioredoxin [Clostridiales bacterium]|nr:thioredoxin [Clostridiales bacterium]
MAEIVLNDENFESEVINSEIPVLVDFWASWCGPCRMLGPVVSQLAEEYDGRIKVGKLDVDAFESLAMEYGISSIPAVKLFKGGRVVAESIGALPYPALKKFVDSNL